MKGDWEIKEPNPDGKWPDLEAWQREADRKNVSILFMGFFLPLILIGVALLVTHYPFQ